MVMVMRCGKFVIIGLFVFSNFLNTISVNAADEAKLEQLLKLYERPENIPFPVSSPYSPQVATLGKMLFFDPRLSSSGTMSCASCHQPSFGWETSAKVAIGVKNIALKRSTPTTLNLAWSNELFWDGRTKTLEEQALGPITNPLEMNSKMSEVIEKLQAIGPYSKWFTEFFPDGLNAKNIAIALATYQRTIVSDISNFDLWVQGNSKAVSSKAKRGFVLFNKIGCASCHSGWNFTDNQFHDIGLKTDDIGRFAIDDSNIHNRYAFKTPTLRNIALRAPYMHNGQHKDLLSVLRHYENTFIKRKSVSLLMQKFTLNQKERDELVEFLNSLTSKKIHVQVPILPN